MSSFLEEYGKVIVVIIVIAALIFLAGVFKTIGSEKATGSFNKFMNIADVQVEEAEKQNKKE